jgi:hypothetical protein
MPINDYDIKVWDGTNWVNKTTIYAWSGSAWVQTRWYAWSGTAWELKNDLNSTNASLHPVHTQTWSSTGHTTWQGDGTVRSDSQGTNFNYQGDWGDAFGNQKSAWFLPQASIASVLGGLGGSSINYARMTATLRGSKLGGVTHAVIGALNTFTPGGNFTTFDLSKVGFVYQDFATVGVQLDFSIGSSLAKFLRDGDDGCLCLYISEADQNQNHAGYWDPNITITVNYNQ